MIDSNSYRDSVLNALPTGWLDPLLTGPGAALPPMGTIGPQHVEALLRGIKARIEALPNGPSARDAVLQECANLAFEKASDFARHIMDPAGGFKHSGAFAVGEAINALRSDATSLPQEGK